MSAIGDALYAWFLTGAGYQFLSGPGGDISELAILGGVYAGLRKVNCEIHGCWRIGKHGTAAGHHLCRKHHPDDKLTVEAAHAAHHAAQRGATVAAYLAMRNASQRDAGQTDYAAAHDAEQAVGSVFTAPPDLGGAVYRGHADPLGRERGADRRSDRVAARHRLVPGARRARRGERAGTGPNPPTSSQEDARDAGGTQDRGVEASDGGGQTPR